MEATAEVKPLPYVPQGQFGFSNKADHLRSVEQFRDAAVADGWSIEPTYAPHEGINRAARLRRDGYSMQILTRSAATGKAPGGWLCEASVRIWGPDGMVVLPPRFYDWSAISAGPTTCGYCGAHPVKTERVGFAGRACPECLPIETKKLPRNWSD